MKTRMVFLFLSLALIFSVSAQEEDYDPYGWGLDFDGETDYDGESGPGDFDGGGLEEDPYEDDPYGEFFTGPDKTEEDLPGEFFTGSGETEEEFSGEFFTGPGETEEEFSGEFFTEESPPPEDTGAVPEEIYFPEPSGLTGPPVRPPAGPGSAGPLFPDEDIPGPAKVAGRYYEVLSDAGAADGELLARELEGRFEEYNRIFRFDTSRIQKPLRVRAYGSREAYDNYIIRRLGFSRPGAVYLHYREPDKRELIIHRGSFEAAQVFPHQAFIQFFRAFVANPPAWMREGFALYFNTLRFNPRDGEGGSLVYAETLTWLEMIRNLEDNIPPIQAILRMDIEGPPGQAEFLSWALVSFLLHSGNTEYFRTLTESFIVLSPEAPAASNAEAVMKRFLWPDIEALERDYRGYIVSRRTFEELLWEGRQAYTTGDPLQAELSFKNALKEKKNHHTPYYFLGLLAYDARNYDTADTYYQSALQYGADPALTAYARGLNASSAGRFEEALGFLEEAAAVSPERYRKRVAELSSRLKQ